MPRPTFLSTMCALWLVAGLAVNADERTASGQDVRATLTSPFSNIFSSLPPGGSVPFRVVVRNDGNSAGTWHIVFQSGANVYSSERTGVIFEQDLPVKANSSGTFDLIVPLMPAKRASSGNRMLKVVINGPGFDEPGQSNFGYFYTNDNGEKSPYMLIGGDVLGPGGSGFLESWYKDESREFYGSVVVADRLPDDWRAYSSVAALCLKDTEWLGLSASQRDAVSSYVAQGGQLILFTSDPPEARAPQLDLPGSDPKQETYGFGRITLVQTSVFPPTAETINTAVEAHAARPVPQIDQDFSTWNLRHHVGTIAVNGVLIIGFVFVFGFLVGPINLFVFAGGKHRFRLFWTTPLISLLASVALVAGILLTDGIGGTGRQVIAILSLPGSHREVVIQEQIARTDLLFSTGWHNDQEYLITPISRESIENALYGTTGMGSRSSHVDLSELAEGYIQQGDAYEGDWFRSRAVSGQYLECVRPSRSALTVLNPEALQLGAAPVVLSSFPEELENVFLASSSNTYWTCSHLQPGRKQTCKRCAEFDLVQFWSDLTDNAGGRLRHALNTVSERPGYFFASGVPLAADRLNTLDEIDWQVTDGIYLGPWVASTAPEDAP